jgi:imidazolonepropionase-like amidohydrolase
MKKILTLLLFSSLTWAQQVPGNKQTESILIKGGTAHIGNGTVLENSYISIKNGKIANISTSAITESHDLVINANNKHIYPGFIAPNSTLGLVEIDAVRASDDESEIGDFNPNVRSSIAYNAESGITETARPNGVLLGQITPRGGRISGTSSIMQFDAWNWEDALIKEGDGIHVNWPSSYTYSWKEEKLQPNKKYSEQLEELNQFFATARLYKTNENQSPDLALLAMKPVLEGKATLFVHVDNENEIMDMVQFSVKNNIKKTVIVGGYYAFKLAEVLKQNNISVLLNRVHSLPQMADEDVNLPYKNASILVKAGVLVALQNAGDMERMQTRNLPFYAGTCAAWGLNKEEALSLITKNSAEILGIDAYYGTLESGKSATLIISNGDALDMRTNLLEHAFIDGRIVNLNDRHKELYERYQTKYNTAKE